MFWMNPNMPSSTVTFVTFSLRLLSNTDINQAPPLSSMVLIISFHLPSTSWFSLSFSPFVVCLLKGVSALVQWVGSPCLPLSLLLHQGSLVCFDWVSPFSAPLLLVSVCNRVGFLWYWSSSPPSLFGQCLVMVSVQSLVVLYLVSLIKALTSGLFGFYITCVIFVSYYI